MSKILKFPPRPIGKVPEDAVQVQVILSGEAAMVINAVLWNYTKISEELYHLSNELDTVYGVPGTHLLSEVAQAMRNTPLQQADES